MMESIVIHDEIKRRLKAAGCSLKIIAADLGCSQGFVTMVSQGKRSSEAVERAIADKLGCSVRDLWPNKFDARNLPSDLFEDRFNQRDIKELIDSGLLQKK